MALLFYGIEMKTDLFQSCDTAVFSKFSRILSVFFFFLTLVLYVLKDTRKYEMLNNIAGLSNGKSSVISRN